MNTTTSAALTLLFCAAALSPAVAQTPTKPTPQAPPVTTAQVPRPMRPDRSEGLVEVKPGEWVTGAPRQPIFSGSMPIYPEAYDYMPAKTP